MKCVRVLAQACMCVCVSVCVYKSRVRGSLTGGDYGPWQARIRTMCSTKGQI